FVSVLDGTSRGAKPYATVVSARGARAPRRGGQPVIRRLTHPVGPRPDRRFTTASVPGRLGRGGTSSRGGGGSWCRAGPARRGTRARPTRGARGRSGWRA